MFGRLFERIIIEVGIALRRGALCVAEQLADNRQAKPGAGADRRVWVAQIVDSDARQAGARRNGLPWLLEVRREGCQQTCRQ